jgi:hypothetical protein
MLSELKEYSEESLSWRDTLSLQELVGLICEQCANPNVTSEDYFSIIVNRKLQKDEDKIRKFSVSIAKILCEEYKLDMDDEAQEDHEAVYDVYKFFVLNSKAVLQTFLYNYICKTSKKDSFLKQYSHLRTDSGDNRNTRDSIIISGLGEIIKDITSNEFSIESVIDELGGKSESPLYKRILKLCEKNDLSSDGFLRKLYKKQKEDIHNIQTFIMIKYSQNYIIQTESPFIFENDMEIEDPDGLDI